MTDLPSVGEQRTDFERRTVPCPNCGNDVLEPRSGDAWGCVGCARQWDPEELPEVDA